MAISQQWLRDGDTSEMAPTATPQWRGSKSQFALANVSALQS